MTHASKLTFQELPAAEMINTSGGDLIPPLAIIVIGDIASGMGGFNPNAGGCQHP